MDRHAIWFLTRFLLQRQLRRKSFWISVAVPLILPIGSVVARTGLNRAGPQPIIIIYSPSEFNRASYLRTYFSTASTNNDSVNASEPQTLEADADPAQQVRAALRQLFTEQARAVLVLSNESGQGDAAPCPVITVYRSPLTSDADRLTEELRRAMKAFSPLKETDPNAVRKAMLESPVDIRVDSSPSDRRLPLESLKSPRALFALMLGVSLFACTLMMQARLEFASLGSGEKPTLEVEFAAMGRYNVATGKFCGTLGVGLVSLGTHLVVISAAAMLQKALHPGMLVAFGCSAVFTLAFHCAVAMILGCLENAPNRPSLVRWLHSTVTTLGIMVIGVAIVKPASTAAQLLSYFPYATAYVLPVRIGLAADFSPWDCIPAVGTLAIVAIALTAWAIRIYPAGVLARGQHLSTRQQLQLVLKPHTFA